MTTTSDALENQEGVQVGFGLLIEGYPYVITDGPLGAVTTAYAGTGYQHALPGLKIEGSIRQSIKPWQNSIDVPTLTFRITPDDSDRFGRDVFKMRPDYRTQLDSLFQAAADGSGTITVKNTSQFATDAGFVYMGNKAMKYSARTATTFTIPAGGAQYLHPFDADGGNKFSKSHTVPGQQNWNQGVATWVTSDPVKWIGRRVALYIHRISGGIWDTKAQAQLEFAGKIVEIEQGELGQTVLQCEDLRAEISDAVLLKGQWVGYVKSGLRLKEGDAFIAAENENGTIRQSGPLTVVASGASGSDEINEGYYEIEDFIGLLNEWVSSDATLTEKWLFGITQTGGEGSRFSISVRFSAANLINSLAFQANSGGRAVFDFLGIDQSQLEDTTIKAYPHRLEAMVSANQTAVFRSSRPPFRIKPFQRRVDSGRVTVELEDSFGDFIDTTDYIPPPYDTWPDSGENWSFFACGGRLLFGRKASGTKIDRIYNNAIGFATYAEDDTSGLTGIAGLTVDDAGKSLEIKQVVILADSFTNIVTRLFASVDGEGINHATYDEFPTAMGCPGIPWGLLGDSFVESCKRLDAAHKTKSMVLLLDKPTPLVDHLIPEIALRHAWLVFKNGGYVFASPPTPNALATEHTLDETNKASKGAEDLRATVKVTNEFMANVISVKFNRTSAGKYRDEIVIRNEASISDYGETKQITIEAPNSYADAASSGAAAENLAASLAQRTLPTFSKPLILVRRHIAPTKYNIAPGDTVTFSDDDCRDLTSGTMGIDGRACICLSVTHNYGHEGGELFGEVELLLTDEDRTYPLAPCAEVDTDFTGTIDGLLFTDGYANAGPSIKLKDHSHSRSADALDVTQFAAGDKIRIPEVDPADPASIDAWDRTILSVDSTDGYITLTATISAPAWSGATKLFEVVPQRYADVTASQKLRAFLADDADGLIQDVAQPNLYGEYPQSGAFALSASSDLPMLIPDESNTEGRPLSSGLLHKWATMGNNLISYKSAPHTPLIWDTDPTSTSSTYEWVCTVPWYIGDNPYKMGRRVINVASRLRVDNAATTGTCLVTSSRHYPSGTAAPAEFDGEKKTVTFTLTGTTTETTQATQELSIVTADLQGYTWLTVELKASGGGQVWLAGFPVFYLSELGA